MTEKLRLNKGEKTKVRISIILLIAIVLAAAAAGYLLGKQGADVNANVVINPDENCIPESELRPFFNVLNQMQNDYQQCVSDLWAKNTNAGPLGQGD